MSMNECHACGAPLAGSAAAVSVVCPFCQTVNHNQEYLRHHISHIDFTRAHNLLKLGLVAYDGGDFRRAEEFLQRVLTEDSTNVDAWIYLALSSAKLADLPSYESAMTKVESLLQRAADLDTASETLLVARSVCANTLGLVALRIVKRHYAEAQKAWFGYESVDSARAEQATNEELKTGLAFAARALGQKPDDLHVAGPIAAYVLMSANFAKGQQSTPVVVNHAREILSTVKHKNPTLSAELEAMIEPPGQKKSGCMGILVLILGCGVLFFLDKGLIL